MSATNTPLPTYKPKDFASDQDVRWCPGCGDYAVLAAVRKALPNIGRRKEDIVFVSGIGCAARFPYYMDTYGMHSIHGRAPAFATGIKLANPELDVWLVSGDGDQFSIGGNHTIHAMRRNVGLRILMLNNRIYGLTKGQYSPTSERGKVTKSTPLGSLDHPVNPLALALAAECTFVARCIDIDAKTLTATMERAAQHDGCAFIEVYQDCNIFNHQAWFYASQKDARPSNTVDLVHGSPLIFGEDRQLGIALVDGQPTVVTIGTDGVTEQDLLVHDETDRSMAFMLSNMFYPALPEPLGVLYCNPDRPAYEQASHTQITEAMASNQNPDIAALVAGHDTWTVEG